MLVGRLYEDSAEDTNQEHPQSNCTFYFVEVIEKYWRLDSQLNSFFLSFIIIINGNVHTVIIIDMFLIMP